MAGANLGSGGTAAVLSAAAVATCTGRLSVTRLDLASNVGSLTGGSVLAAALDDLFSARPYVSPHSFDPRQQFVFLFIVVF